ncbi:tyrosine-type recombinase/integrase [Limimaricola pyoseonensis]|uniref:Site-specific recombinase XerC n=1 Tax=Limimaricola pyoseonensis TaxID=521013 RepID=A0A1G7GT06_9RHOB|nr:tyrosine-type recombinase/integrase [Limimaricola pyoseonensis]SDE91308.1 Site-specific recombinase XerC [Limimaricola pyoseonensis]
MIYLRGTTWFMRRRRPKRYAAVDPREILNISLATDSERIAREKEAAVWGELVEGWEAKLAGRDGDAEERYQAARDLAQQRGFRFRRMEEVAKMPTAEILDRVEAISDVKGKPDEMEAAALLGTARPPALTISRALEAYWTLARDKTLGKSADQLRRWRNPHIKAIRNLIGVVGDVELERLTPDDMQDFRDWWIDKVEEGDVIAASANKDFTYVGAVLRLVAARKRLGFVPPTPEPIKAGRQNTRLPFSVDWIRDRIIPGLGGLNGEARAIVLVMVNTGMRPSEIANLGGDRIQLEGSIPHVQVRPEGRQLKNDVSERDVPLVGVSLEAMRGCPEGFPRYLDKAGLSATVNKYLRENGLSETPRHTLYGLRHSVEDRLLIAGVDERVRRDILGHSLNRQRYGDGGGLPMKLEALQRIAL